MTTFIPDNVCHATITSRQCEGDETRTGSKIRYFVKDGVISSPVSDIADIAQICRGKKPYESAFENVASQVFRAKTVRQSPQCAPILTLLRAFGDHTLSNLGKIACRHLICVIDAFCPGDSIPLEIIIPPPAAINSNTIRPETAEELHEDPSTNPDSIPTSPTDDSSNASSSSTDIFEKMERLIRISAHLPESTQTTIINICGESTGAIAKVNIINAQKSVINAQKSVITEQRKLAKNIAGLSPRKIDLLIMRTGPAEVISVNPLPGATPNTLQTVCMMPQ